MVICNIFNYQEIDMNIFNMAKDLKGMEKMMKPALEKFMNESGFVKKEALERLEKRVSELEKSMKDINNR
tara:strand:- start:108 stop:317 length:210 start_codon:yes stop_codon:yes gene_type:complete